MTMMTAVRATKPAARAASAPEIVRFRAGNGAVVAVTVKTGEGRQRALDLAREAVADVARTQAQTDRGETEGEGGCDATYWSWALPDGWRR